MDVSIDGTMQSARMQLIGAMSLFVTRFAPSPTGYLHLGHAFSAREAFEAARAAGGRFLLRIEDIDRTRCRPEFAAALLEDLAWLGLKWETPVRRQSDHFLDYRNALDRLIAKGVMYRCFKTRREVMEDIARAPHRSGEGADDPPYPGPTAPMSPDEEQARLASGAPFAWRLSLARCRDLLGEECKRLTFTEEGAGPRGESGEILARPELLGDAILARKDVGTSYHLACVHDDGLQGVTHVIRGQDLFVSAHLQRLLQALLDLPAVRYRHHRLLADAGGQRLAKRAGALSIRSLRAEGHSPQELLQEIR
jgi:glutamyl-Q tRNA(Asp) synthetase